MRRLSKKSKSNIVYVKPVTAPYKLQLCTYTPEESTRLVYANGKQENKIKVLILVDKKKD